MTVEIAIIGKPSSGKSSFFKAATMIDVPIEARPFTTIKPNRGLGYVVTDCVCVEFGVKCNPKNSICSNGKRRIPINLIDVAGLVPDAHRGKGLGNKFLDDLRQAPCFVQIVDASGTTDAEGKPTSGYDPREEVRFLTREIDLWFANIIRSGLGKYAKKSKHAKIDLAKVLSQQLSGLGITEGQIRTCLERTSVEDVEKFATELRKISKPMIVAANKIDLDSSEENLKRMKEEFPKLTIIPTCAIAEIALRAAKERGLIEYEDGEFKIKDGSKMDERQLNGLKFIEEKVVKKYGSTGVQGCLNEAVFDVMNYIVVYPVADVNKLSDKKGNVLPDAFLVKKGTTLREFAEKIHTDLAEKFIGGMDAKTKKKLGANHELKDKDVVEILFRKR